MATARIAMAGPVPICQDIVLEAVAKCGGIEHVKAWTSLASLRGATDVPEILLISLEISTLPNALRVMLAAAPGLRIVALNEDCSTATVFELHETREVLLRPEADDLCKLLFPDLGPRSLDPKMSRH